MNATNIMYAFHFYAASHKDNYRAEVSRAAATLPLFVTEFGTVSATGGGAVDTASSTAWLDLLDQLKISYANWTYSDAAEGSAAFKPGTCAGSTYAGTGVAHRVGHVDPLPDPHRRRLLTAGHSAEVVITGGRANLSPGRPVMRAGPIFSARTCERPERPLRALRGLPDP